MTTLSVLVSKLFTASLLNKAQFENKLSIKLKTLTKYKYYATYHEFKNRCLDFLEKITQYKEKLCSLLTENFQIIGE